MFPIQDKPILLPVNHDLLQQRAKPIVQVMAVNNLCSRNLAQVSEPSLQCAIKPARAIDPQPSPLIQQLLHLAFDLPHSVEGWPADRPISLVIGLYGRTAEPQRMKPMADLIKPVGAHVGV
jgi:hypothetical protein